MSKNKPTVKEILKALAGIGDNKWREEILSHASIKNLAEAQKRLDELEREKK